MNSNGIAHMRGFGSGNPFAMVGTLPPFATHPLGQVATIKHLNRCIGWNLGANLLPTERLGLLPERALSSCCGDTVAYVATVRPWNCFGLPSAVSTLKASHEVIIEDGLFLSTQVFTFGYPSSDPKGRVDWSRIDFDPCWATACFSVGQVVRQAIQSGMLGTLPGVELLWAAILMPQWLMDPRFIERTIVCTGCQVYTREKPKPTGIEDSAHFNASYCLTLRCDQYGRLHIGKLHHDTVVTSIHHIGGADAAYGSICVPRILLN